MSSTASGRAKILASALQEFCERGFDGARVDRIAADAGVNKALLYYHFKSKDELYIAVIDYLFNQVPAEPQRVAGGSVRDRLLHALAEFVTFLHDHPMFVRMIDQDVLRGGNLVRKAQRQIAVANTWVEYYQEGVARGEFRQLDNPMDYVISMLGSCYFFYSHRNNLSMFYPADLDESQVLQMRIRTIQDMAARVFFA